MEGDGQEDRDGEGDGVGDKRKEMVRKMEKVSEMEIRKEMVRKMEMVREMEIWKEKEMAGRWRW